ncbi:MAG: UDP-N-acetylenolpyruvoylglucosamine reductase [Flavobacteriaceae bacterium]|nr:UDP-N-acetylenolpyruvoylglucosamine reductase [Flavobacteriaceae bacterium]|tara:strand:+ start:13176 stop:14183 length:1008 start_codon:yes stop_codon:yes gene_type:complete
MVNFKNNVSLLPYNTFGVDVNTSSFIKVKKTDDLLSALKKKSFENFLVIGQGSNILFTKDFPGLTILMDNHGKEIIKENRKEVIIKVQSGENWHEFVLWCLKNNYGGVENLSLIPGKVGGAPIQNIGAYGVEIKDVFLSCNTLEISSLTFKEFNLKECNFRYRDSIFKSELKGKYIIISVTLKLQKYPHNLNTSYGDLEKMLEGKKKTIQNIAESIIKIRSSKLPDPKILGNCGSFFKNPIILKSKLKNLKETFKEVPFYPHTKDKIKIPAAWIIEKLGYKGYNENNVGVYKNHSLVLINLGNAKGKDVKLLAEKIRSEVFNVFSISLEYEVNIW